MNTDRELLEFAAKAAGITLAWSRMDGQSPRDRSNWNAWNPLTDDGDALRLAVKLRIGLDHNRPGDQQRYVAADRPGCEGCFAPVCCVEDEFDEQHRDAATRRAIVRAAAEIGKAMP